MHLWIFENTIWATVITIIFSIINHFHAIQTSLAKRNFGVGNITRGHPDLKPSFLSWRRRMMLSALCVPSEDSLSTRSISSRTSTIRACTKVTRENIMRKPEYQACIKPEDALFGLLLLRRYGYYEESNWRYGLMFQNPLSLSSAITMQVLRKNFQPPWGCARTRRTWDFHLHRAHPHMPLGASKSQSWAYQGSWESGGVKKYIRVFHLQASVHSWKFLIVS